MQALQTLHLGTALPLQPHVCVFPQVVLEGSGVVFCIGDCRGTEQSIFSPLHAYDMRAVSNACSLWRGFSCAMRDPKCFIQMSCDVFQLVLPLPSQLKRFPQLLAVIAYFLCPSLVFFHISFCFM